MVQGVVVKENHTYFVVWSVERHHSWLAHDDIPGDLKFDIEPLQWIEYDVQEKRGGIDDWPDGFRTRAFNCRIPSGAQSRNPCTHLEDYGVPENRIKIVHTFTTTDESIKFREKFTISSYHSQPYIEGNFLGRVRCPQGSIQELLKYNLTEFYASAELDLSPTVPPEVCWKLTQFVFEGKELNLNGFLSKMGCVRRGKGGYVMPKSQVKVPPDTLRLKEASTPSAFYCPKANETKAMPQRSVNRQSTFETNERAERSACELRKPVVVSKAPVPDTSSVIVHGIVVHASCEESHWLMFLNGSGAKSDRLTIDLDVGLQLGGWYRLKLRAVTGRVTAEDVLSMDQLTGPDHIVTRFIPARDYPQYCGSTILTVRAELVERVPVPRFTCKYVNPILDVKGDVPASFFDGGRPPAPVVLEVCPDDVGWFVVKFHGHFTGDLAQLEDSFVPRYFKTITDFEEAMEAEERLLSTATLDNQKEERTLKELEGSVLSREHSPRREERTVSSSRQGDLPVDNCTRLTHCVASSRQSCRHDESSVRQAPATELCVRETKDRVLPSVVCLDRLQPDTTHIDAVGVVIGVSPDYVVLFCPRPRMYRIYVPRDLLSAFPSTVKCGVWMRTQVVHCEVAAPGQADGDCATLAVTRPEPVDLATTVPGFEAYVNHGVFKCRLQCNLGKVGAVVDHGDYNVLTSDNAGLKVVVPSSRIRELFVDSTLTAPYTIRFMATSCRPVREIALRLLNSDSIDLIHSDGTVKVLRFSSAGNPAD